MLAPLWRGVWRQFDRLARAVSEASTRRGLLGLLTALPLLGGLLAVRFDRDDATAKGRHKRRKQRRRQRCRPQSLAETCADRCGTVQNKCKKTVDCGACACEPPCPICQTCDERTGQCTDLTDGTACGDGVQCQAGQCVCDGASCVDGCCQDDQCHVADAAACGSGGGACSPCGEEQVCFAGTCQICGLRGQPCCAGESCSGLAICHDGTCERCGDVGQLCCAGESCIGSAICRDGTCQECGLRGQPCCPGGICFGAPCSGGQCEG